MRHAPRAEFPVLCVLMVGPVMACLSACCACCGRDPAGPGVLATATALRARRADADVLSR
jgi:hypothetical protein